MDPVSVFSELGDVPFLAPAFRPKSLLTIAACVRRNIGGADDPIEAFLTPARAVDDYKNAVSYAWPEVDSVELGGEDMRAVNTAIVEIVQLMPDWVAMFALPINWRKLDDRRISVTNRTIPQHIYLGARAFDGVQNGWTKS